MADGITNGNGTPGPPSPEPREPRMMAAVAALMGLEFGPVRVKELLDLAAETFVAWGVRGLSPSEMALVGLFLTTLADRLQGASVEEDRPAA